MALKQIIGIPAIRMNRVIIPGLRRLVSITANCIIKLILAGRVARKTIKLQMVLMAMSFMIWQAMSLSGATTGTARVITVQVLTIILRAPGAIIIGSFAAATGTTVQGSCAPRVGATAPRSLRAGTLAFGASGRLSNFNLLSENGTRLIKIVYR